MIRLARYGGSGVWSISTRYEEWGYGEQGMRNGGMGNGGMRNWGMRNGGMTVPV